MDPATKDSLLWGLVGAMSFLVLIQGYHLLSGAFVGWTRMAVVAVVVFGATTATVHVLRPRLATRNERA